METRVNSNTPSNKPQIHTRHTDDEIEREMVGCGWVGDVMSYTRIYCCRVAVVVVAVWLCCCCKTGAGRDRSCLLPRIARQRFGARNGMHAPGGLIVARKGRYPTGDRNSQSQSAQATNTQTGTHTRRRDANAKLGTKRCCRVL